MSARSVTQEEMEGEEEDPQPQQQPPSLFPLFAHSSSIPGPSTTAGSGWLCNTSFNANVSAIPTPATFAVVEEGSSEEEDLSRPTPRQASYDLVASPAASSHTSSSESGRRRKHNERKRKHKRKRRRRDGANEEGTRKSGVRLWAASDSDKDILFDVQGDPDNLAFGSLYRMDVPRYKHHSFIDLSGSQFGSIYRWRYSCLDEETDNNSLDNKLSDGGRYFSAKYFALEGHKNFKHVKITKKIQSRSLADFIPIKDEKSSPDDNFTTEESWEDEVLRKTKEFNKMTRESPHDEKAWIAFADFQDKVSSRQPQKAARLQTLEKKISILEKAVELNPGNEDLLLHLLKTYEKRDSGEALIARWEKVLTQNYGSYKLWKEFLVVCQGEFSRFKVSDIRKRYAHAIQALSSAYSRTCRQVQQSDKLVDTDGLVQLELGLVDIFVSLCRFEWQTGFQEVATALFQAEIEYSLLSPSLDLSIQNKLRLFQHFWESGGARVGEEGAVGWSTWIEEEQNRQNTEEDSAEETEVSGWSGWFNPSVSNAEKNMEKEASVEQVNGEGTTEDNIESDGAKEEDIEILLRKLGVNVDAEPQSEIKDSATWNRWSEEELLRDSQQWMPVHENSGNADNNQLSWTILFEDISDYLFSLQSDEARFCLISRFIEFYGIEIPQRICTNDTSWISNGISLDIIPDSVLGHLYDAFDIVTTEKNHFLEVLIGGLSDTKRSDTMKFLRNAILLVLKIFHRNYKLQEALLLSEESATLQMSSCSVTPSQGLAKHLLKSDRQDLLLSGLYARREAAHGNIDRARKVFDMTLLLMNELPLDIQRNATLLFLWYAEMELDYNKDEHANLRAIHILSCLGGGAVYTPFGGKPSGLLILKAHNGFKDQIVSLRSEWFHGCITDHSVAVVCSASLFELLTVGWKASTEIYDEAFSMALPERKCQSVKYEYLSMRYVNMIMKHVNDMKFLAVWSKLLQQLQSYPQNPTILSSIIKVSRKYTVPQKIRLILDEFIRRKPSIHVFLLALMFELERSSSQYRVRGLFERALTNDKLQKSVVLWRCYLAFEFHFVKNASAVRRIFFRAIHACPWSKKLWLDGFQRLNSVLTPNELSDLYDVMRDKELNMRTDIYEILLQDEAET